MSNHHQLLFFNKEGDYLNFNYNNTTDRFEGDILFHENSSDTFKTAGIYMLEQIPSFEYEYPGSLELKKFQLFNEWGLNFYSASYLTQSVTKIEPVNNDPGFYSKWIYGVDFDKKFPLGTIIRFNNSFLEFTNPTYTFPVVSSKKGAIMIISNMDNETFETSFKAVYNNSSTYSGKTISGVNAIGVYKYIDSKFQNNLATWNEPSFHTKIYKKKKLNIIGTELNDGVVTVDKTDYTDIRHFEYSGKLTTNSAVVLEISTKGDLPKVYEGGLTINSDSTINFASTIPAVLKPGREFKISNSSLNQNFFNVSSIGQFGFIKKRTYFPKDTQVLWNNKIYQCIQSYTHSFSDSVTRFVTPESGTYWTSSPTYLKVDQTTIPEILSTGQVYLTTDKIYFDGSFTMSQEVTMASAVEKWKDSFKSFNIDLYFKNSTMYADLIYPGKYAEVNFYKISNTPANLLTKVTETYERLIGVSDSLEMEYNYDYSENFRINIVFTDIDEFGIKIIINKQVYEEEVVWVYSGAAPDMERTIDKTLKRWLSRWYVELFATGVTAVLRYTGSFTSPFHNSILLKTQYPNVPLILNEVQVGITANHYIEHSTVLFTDMGGYLTITINGEEYGQSVTRFSGVADIGTTLQNWFDEHSDYLSQFGIIVTNINNLLKFDVKSLESNLTYSINTGKINLPGIETYKITDKLKGNEGSLITSNEIILGTYSGNSFEDVGFATGMVLSINNTFYTWHNQEYNVQFLDPGIMSLSYQGPFWGTLPDACEASDFLLVGFNTGFGVTACAPLIGGTGGPYDLYAFSSGYAVTGGSTNFSLGTFNFNSYVGTTLIDIKYIQLSNWIYAYGINLIVIDPYTGDFYKSITLTGNSNPILLDFNPANNYIYCLSKNIIYRVDPLINEVVDSITLSDNASDIKFNTNPSSSGYGDVYVTFTNTPQIRIYDADNTLMSTITTPSTFDTKTGQMAFNQFESDMYVLTDDSGTSNVLRIDGSTRTIQTTYTIPGSRETIYYEPINESIYVWGTSNLYKIDNGVVVSITGIPTSGNNDIIFNQITNEINYSNASTIFVGLNLDTNAVTFDNAVSHWGYLGVNEYDTFVYLSSQTLNNVLILNSYDGSVVSMQTLPAKSGKIIFNPERNTMWTIVPSLGQVIEIVSTVTTTITATSSQSDITDDNQYGTLDPNYKPYVSTWIKSREYFRRPRENFQGETPVKFYWKWYSDTVPEFFLYDFSGDQLQTTGSYSYTGPKPLNPAVLNKNPNKDVTKVSLPEYQQTIFDKLETTLSYIDDEDDFSIEVNPIETFIGYQSKKEGALRSILQLYKSEPISFTFSSNSTNGMVITLDTMDSDLPTKWGRIKIDQNSTDTFLGKGLKPGQLISISVTDYTNTKNQYISDNNGLILKVRNVFFKTLEVDFISTLSSLKLEKTVITGYPTTGKTTYLRLNIRVLDREIGRFVTYGQTEIEDPRFKIELGNVGKLIGPNEVFIYKDYDILEGGIDWNFLNMKRKEMLMMKHLIYPYIGSYKSIINAINHFGYNDLELNEYYRNINRTSEKFGKLFKVEIPDIFDNTVEGFTESDFIKNIFPNEDYEETNLFNLTYKITDKEGNNILNYSLDEIIIKLQGLKYWLKRNIIPLTHKILDITGTAWFVGGTQIVHTSYDVQFFNIRENMTPISFKLNEAYLMPINTGSTVYNCVIDFYTILEGVGADKNPLGLPLDPVKPYNGIDTSLPSYFDVTVRTYKTYPEWKPFVTYDKGDKVFYYNKIWESMEDSNKVNNPRKYENTPLWQFGSIYDITAIVKWNNEIWSYSAIASGTASTSTVPPPVDSGNWFNLTKWKEIKQEPVQTLKEWRKIDLKKKNPVLPFNFTVDSNIDPFIVIEVTSENGYGSVYRDKKNYEIRGLKDLEPKYTYIDKIGPFEPIVPVY